MPYICYPGRRRGCKGTGGPLREDRAFHERKQADALLSRFLLMRNLEELVAGVDRYILKKRGIFETTGVRSRPPAPGDTPPIAERHVTPSEVEEIEYRFAALKPYLVS
jgi:hypothetical protein